MALLLRVFKAEAGGDLLHEGVWDEELLRAAREVLESVLRYIMAGDVDAELFERRVQGLGDPDLKQTGMTLAEQLIERGMERGVERGRSAAARDAVFDALEVRFGEVSAAIRERVEAVEDVAGLRELYRLAICCRDPSEFAEALAD